MESKIKKMQAYRFSVQTIKMLDRYSRLLKIPKTEIIEKGIELYCINSEKK